MALTGSRPAPTHVLAHLSDTHLIAAGGLLAGHIDTEAQLRKALARVESSGERVDALVLSGDLARWPARSTASTRMPRRTP